MPRPRKVSRLPAKRASRPVFQKRTAAASSSIGVQINASPLAGTSPPAVTEVPLADWLTCGAAVTGLAHWRKGLPCQDAVAWRQSPRPILALSDGAGSAAVSERGATALVAGMCRFLESLDDAVALWVDQPTPVAPDQASQWSARLLRHAQGLLGDLAAAERRSVRDLRATLLLVVIGKARSFWWQVGDGSIAVRGVDGLRALGDTAKSKGEFANQTCFVDTAVIADVQSGLLPSAEISGLALMSDGGAERLVATDGSRIAPRIGEWLESAAAAALSPDKLAVAFHEPAMWERTSLDDRSIVLAARTGSITTLRGNTVAPAF